MQAAVGLRPQPRRRQPARPGPQGRVLPLVAALEVVLLAWQLPAWPDAWLLATVQLAAALRVRSAPQARVVPQARTVRGRARQGV